MTVTSQTKHHEPFQTPSEDAIYNLLSRLGIALETSVRRSNIVSRGSLSDDLLRDPLSGLTTSAAQVGILVKEANMDDVDDAIGFLEEGFPLVVAQPDGTLFLLTASSGRRFEATMIGNNVSHQSMNRQTLDLLLFTDMATRLFVAKKELECDSFSSAPPQEPHHDQYEPMLPLRRFLGLLSMERRDIWMVALFAFVSGVLTLATPLAVESLVNVVSWGTYVQPLIVLG